MQAPGCRRAWSTSPRVTSVVDDPIITQSALKHGLDEDQILHAYRNPIRVWDLGDGFTMMIGATPPRSSFRSDTLTAKQRSSSSRDAGQGEVSEVMSDAAKR